MKALSRLAAAAVVALMLVPTMTATASYANDNGRCSVEDDDRDDCKRKPKFQTKFFSE